MVLDQQKSRRKETGAVYKRQHAKKKHVVRKEPVLTKIDPKTASRRDRVRGSNYKQRVLRTNVVNLYNPKTKKHSKATAEAVVENPANRHFVRRNIMTLGTIIRTDKGKARITSRPGQDGMVNAVLV